MRIPPPAPVRLAPHGTRVVVIKNATNAAGVVREIRTEPHLKTYVIACDDGSTVYASAHDLALEADDARTALGPCPEY